MYSNRYVVTHVRQVYSSRRVIDQEKRAMGVSLCEPIQQQMKGLPELYSHRTLQAPINVGHLTTNASVTVPSTLKGLGEFTISIQEFSTADERELKLKSNPMLSLYGEMELGEKEGNQRTTSGRSAFGLGKTMRDLIHVRNRETEETDKTYLYPPSEREEDVTRRIDSEEEDIGPCLPKCLLAGFLVLGIIGGMIAILVVVRGGGAEGSGRVNKDPEAYPECSNITVALNKTFSIQCMVNESHRNWTELQQTGIFRVISPDQVEYNLTTNSTVVDKNLTWMEQVPVKVLCPLSGYWSVEFRNNKSELLYISSFFLTISDPPLTVTKSNSSCSLSNGCGNFDIKFVDKSTNYTMDETKRCNGSSSYETGMNLECTTEQNIDNIKCVLYNSTFVVVKEVDFNQH